MNELKILYTEEAKKLLPKLLNGTRRKLEERVKMEKYVLGDDVVEISAADIKSAIESLHSNQFVQRNPAKSLLNYRVVVSFYGILGVITTIAGVYFESIRAIVSSDPQRAFLILTGVLITLLAAVLTIFIRQRERADVSSIARKISAERGNDTLSQLETETLSLLRQIDELKGKTPRGEI